MATGPERPQEAGPARHRLLLRVSTRRDVEIGLETSLTLAVALRRELAALFVEEEASIRACALPLQTMVSFSGGTMAMDAGGIEAALRREAQACRRLLAGAAERARLAWSFQAGRGEALQLLRQASTAGDILVLGLDRIGTPAWEMLAAARSLAPPHGGILLLPQRPARLDGLVMTLGHGAAPAEALRPVAAQLAEALHAGQNHASTAEATPGELAAHLARARLLLARAESPLFDEPAELHRLATALRTPLLLLRTEG